MNPITGILSPAGRKSAYFAYAALGLIVGTLQVILAVYGLLEVKWFLATSGVYAYLGTAFGFVAANNTGPEVSEPLAEPQAIETDLAPEDEEFAEPALVNDIEPVDDEIFDQETDDTPPPEDYRPRH